MLSGYIKSIGDYTTFCVVMSNPKTDGSACDASTGPSYRIYEDETATPIVTGSMAKLDDDNTTGFYSERTQLSSANGYEVGKDYNIYVEGTISGIKYATTIGPFSITDDGHSSEEIADNIDGLKNGVTISGINDTAKAQIESEVTDALNTYDPPTKLELDNVEDKVDLVKNDTLNLNISISGLETQIGTKGVGEASLHGKIGQYIGGGSDDIESELNTIMNYTGTSIPSSISNMDDKIDIIDTNLDSVLVDTNETQTKLPLGKIAEQSSVNAGNTMISGLPTVAQIDSTLSSSHGSGSWQASGGIVEVTVTGINTAAKAQIQTEVEDGLNNYNAVNKSYLDATITGLKGSNSIIDLTILETKIDAITSGGIGPGSYLIGITVRDEHSNPIAEVNVWVSTDIGGNNVIAGTRITNSAGLVQFMLDKHVSYYLWRQKDGYIFDNPKVFTPT